LSEIEVDALSLFASLITLVGVSISGFISVNFLWSAAAPGSHKRGLLLNLHLRRFGDRRFVRCESNVKDALLYSDMMRPALHNAPND